MGLLCLKGKEFRRSGNELKTKYYIWFKVALFVLVLYLGETSNIVCLLQPSYVPIGSGRLHGSDQIYFVPLHTFPRSVLERFVDFYRNKYGLNISILPALSLPEQAFNKDRGQFVAEELIRQLERMSQASQLESGSTIIALTDRDIYIQEYTWRYAFSFRTGRLAVVSSARMDHRFMGVWPIDQEWQETRLRKMVTKDIGVLYYDLPLSSHCRSPVFGRIGGPQELDFMGEDL